MVLAGLGRGRVILSLSLSLSLFLFLSPALDGPRVRPPSVADARRGESRC